MITQANKCSQRIFINGSDHFLKTVSKELNFLVCEIFSIFFLVMIDYAQMFGSNKIFYFTQESDLLQKVQCCACQIRLRDYKLSPKRHAPSALFLKLFFFMFFDADSACYIHTRERKRKIKEKWHICVT